MKDKIEHQKHKIRFRKKQLDNQAQRIKEQAERIAQLSKDFYLKFGESPSQQQMSALVKDDPNEISPDIVKSIYYINIKEYDQDWLKRTG